MTSQNPDAIDAALLERYRQASSAEGLEPTEAVRAAILAEGRRIAQQRAAAPPLRSFDTSRPAANQSRFRLAAFGTFGVAILAALLIVPRWLISPASRPQLAATQSAPASARDAAAQASAPKEDAPTTAAAPPTLADAGPCLSPAECGNAPVHCRCSCQAAADRTYRGAQCTAGYGGHLRSTERCRPHQFGCRHGSAYGSKPISLLERGSRGSGAADCILSADSLDGGRIGGGPRARVDAPGSTCSHRGSRWPGPHAAAGRNSARTGRDRAAAAGSRRRSQCCGQGRQHASAAGESISVHGNCTAARRRGRALRYPFACTGAAKVPLVNARLEHPLYWGRPILR